MAHRTGRSQADHDEFAEDTLLPPPAPGLVAPHRVADHLAVDTEPNAPVPVLDSTTAPGLGPRSGSGLPPSPARAIARVAEHHPPPLPRELVAERSLPHPAPPELRGEHPESTPRPSALSPVVHEPTPPSLLSYQTAESSARRATSLPPLPELPAGPHGESGAALVGYMLRYRRTANRRQRLIRRAEQSLQRETPSVDRLLVELGQYAYIERMDPWGLLAAQQAGQLAGYAEDPALSGQVPRLGGEGELQRRAEAWIVRIEAEQLRALAILSREEARLASELMGRAELCRRLRWHIESMPLPASYEQQAELSALRGESDVLLQQLALVRSERWMKEHALGRCQRQRPMLVQTIESLLTPAGDSATRATPNLLLLGALLLGQRLFSLQPAEGPQPPQPRSGGGRAAAAMAPALAVARFQDRLLPRALMSAQGMVERWAYDRDAVRRGGIFLGVFGVTACLCALIAWWALSAS